MNNGIKFGKWSCLLWILSMAAGFAGPLDNAWIKGITDKDPVRYHTGDEVTLTLTVESVFGKIPADTYFVKWIRTGDDGKTAEGRVPLGKEPIIIKTVIGTPGFFRVQAYVVDAQGARYKKAYTGDTSTPEGKKAMNEYEKRPRYIFFDGGAGADIDKLRSAPEPRDFDAFWKRHKETLAKVPFDKTALKEIKKDKNGTVYAVAIPCAGARPVTGYLSIPAKPGKYPARLGMQGYGTSVQQPFGVAKAAEIYLEINAHGYELGRDAAYYGKFFNTIKYREKSGKTVPYAFSEEQNADPETAYFCGMSYRVMRALQFLKSRPEWNGEDLIASGGSQGGLQSIWAAGLDSAVTEVSCAVPWCCDMAGATKKYSGWYVHWTPALEYYDPVNICKRISPNCKFEITRAGLGDYTCPPAGLAVLYNHLPCQKKICWWQGSQHGYAPPTYPERITVRQAPARQ